MPLASISQLRSRRHIAPPSGRTSSFGVFPVQISHFARSLSGIEEGNLVLRGGGLSIFQCCRLKLDKQLESPGHEELAEGLFLKSEDLDSVWLIESENEPPRFEVSMREAGGSFSYYPPGNPTARQELDQIQQLAIAYQRMSNQQPPTVNSVWLDQQLEAIDEIWQTRALLQTTPAGATAKIEMQSSNLSFRCAFEVTSFDRIDRVVRLASSQGETAIHLAAASMQAQPVENGLLLTNNTPNRPAPSALLENWTTSFLYR